MLLKSQCPSCFGVLEYDPAETQEADCPSCEKKVQLKKKMVARPFGLCCPLCRSDKISAPTQKINTTGKALIIIGAIFTVAIVGLILILIGMRMKETKYHCYNCLKWF